jgi:hypothetical protein
MSWVASVMRIDRPVGNGVSSGKRLCLTAVLFCCTSLAGWFLDTPTFGQLGFQQQFQVQQWQQRMQAQNFVTERMYAKMQQTSLRRLSQERSPRQQRVWRARGNWARSR